MKKAWNTRFISDVFLFIAPDGYIDTQDEINNLMRISEEKGAQSAHRFLNAFISLNCKRNRKNKIKCEQRKEFSSTSIFKGSFLNYAVAKDGSYYRASALKLSDDGKCTVYLSYNDDAGNEHTFVQQYAYIAQCSGFPYLNSFSIILLDGEKVYYYTDSVTDREAHIMKSTGTDVDGMDDAVLEKIAEKRSDLYDDLCKEFEANGISVQINRSTGEIAMDSTVLFGGDSAELTAAGKEFLNKFVKAYTAIIYNEKYDGFIAKTLVEGHIAPLATSTYESGLPLSEQRAKNVMDYCLSRDTAVDTAKLASTMETIGCSQSKPVYDSNGNVDLAASRRVSFKFVINTDHI